MRFVYFNSLKSLNPFSTLHEMSIFDSMKKILRPIGFILFLSCVLPAVSYAQKQSKKLASFVNPFIGTGGHGHTFPGPVMPFGACQVGPDTRLSGWDGCSGYHYSDSVIHGFSHTHLSGTGCSDYGDILLMPTTKEVAMKDYDYASGFSHDNEKAGAGYYNVRLDKWAIDVRLTCTQRTGIHEYTFPKGQEQFVVLDLKHRDEVLDSHLEIVNDSTIRGYRYSKAWAKNQKIYFYLRFSRPFKEARYANDTKAKSQTSPIVLEKQLHTIFIFGKNDNPLLVKVAISGVDEEGAEKNMKKEAPHWNFATYKQQAAEAWEQELSKIKVKQVEDLSMKKFENESKAQHSNASSNQLTIFYTALYHTMIHPSIYNDVDGRYRGRDDKIHNTEGKFDYYTVFSLWDTYRGLHPLLSILDKKRTNDFINTFIKEYEQGGRLPIWELSSNETNCMVGYHVVSVMWDAYNKGIRGYDAQMAFQAMKSIGTEPSDYTKVNGVLTMKEIAKARCGDADALESYNRYGYVRCDDAHESVSKTLEYAYNDWCIAQMANALGKKSDYDYYMNRSHNWKNVYDPTTGFMRARKNGSLYSPFSPYTVDNNFTEANSWQYSFYVPHDLGGLSKLYGKSYRFADKLDELFNANEKTEGREQADITGLIGQYAHGNEPSHQIAYLYNYAGREDMTVQRTNFIMNNFYKNEPDGLIGNEDCGQMSAWFVLSAMGIYPVCPGNNTYDLTEPLFDEILINEKISLKKVKTSGNNKPSFYTINNKSTLSHAELLNVQPKLFKASSKPGTQRSVPLSADIQITTPFIVDAPRIFKQSQKVDIRCNSEADIYYMLNGGQEYRYQSPFYINDNVDISFYSVLSADKSKQSPIQHASFTKLPIDRQVILKSTYNKSYSAGGAESMIDGIYGKLNWRAGDWQGYQGQDVETIIAFDKPKEIKSIAANFLEDQNAWIFYPKEVAFYVSDDSTHWTLIETIPTNKSDHAETVSISKFRTEIKNQASAEEHQKVKFVKMVAKNFGVMPQWHEGRGFDTFIFIDEIEIR